MRIAEITCTVSQNGSLRIPHGTVVDMGLKAGDHIRIAYIIDDNKRNVYREILLSGKPLDAPAAGIMIPAEFLEQAQIPLDANLRVVFTQGTIVLSQNLAVSDGQLRTALARLKIAGEVIQHIIDPQAE